MKIKIIIALMVVVAASACQKTPKEIFNPDSYINYCVEKANKTVSSLGRSDRLPRNILQGQKTWNTVDILDWCSGFFPGYLWYAYEALNDIALLNEAERFTAPLAGILDVPVINHDLGFQLYCSMGNAYRLTGDKKYRDVLLLAADSLVSLYNPKVGTILSWPEMVEKKGWSHNTIIDNMINLELLFFAAKNGRGKAYYDMAVSHAEVTMNTLVRDDYTTYHVAVFDAETGDFIKGVTHQGYADESLWARGQGWGIYGYAMTYRETKDKRFLETSMKLADVFIDKMPEDAVPFWDFNDPNIPNAPRDASAAAVVASGLLELSTYMTDAHLKQKYYITAVKLLEALSSDAYLSRDANASALLHSTGHYPKGSEIDASIIYADYYYLEGLLRLKKLMNKQTLF